ncbi:Serine/threonine protein phosphatase 2A, partial [Scheffersomyces stipitis CBS 6054]
EEYEVEEEHSWTPVQKASMYGGGFFVGLFALYFFTLYLPSYFIPEATDLVAIKKVSQLDVALTPLAGGTSVALGDYTTLGFDSEYSEQSSKKRNVNRIIMVGDVHAHYTQFRKLLNKVKYNKKNDHLLLLGDFITKGPDSRKILDYLIANDVDCILGNHEYYALQNYATFHGLDQPSFEFNGTIEKFLGDGSSFLVKDGFNDDPEFLIAKKLEPEHVQYINNCSIIKKLGTMPLQKSKGGANGVAVHAGIRWDLDLQDQDPIDNLEMRSLIGPYFNETTSDPDVEDSVSWSKIFNMKQKEKSAHDKDLTVVYYGHDARRGLNLKQYTKGLDSGCDRGDKLTAMVVWAELSRSKKGSHQIVYKEEPVQIHC